MSADLAKSSPEAVKPALGEELSSRLLGAEVTLMGSGYGGVTGSKCKEGSPGGFLIWVLITWVSSDGENVSSCSVMIHALFYMYVTLQY